MFDSVDHVVESLAAQRFRATRAAATATYLAARVGNPLLIQGPHGTGKTALARAIVAAEALQLVEFRNASDSVVSGDPGTLLLVDDIASSLDPRFDALTELLLSVEGAVVARQPWVVLTSSSNDPSLEPLREPCRVLALGYPEFDHEVGIVVERVPGMSRGLAGQLCNIAARLRLAGYERPPGVGESISWARALVGLRCSRIDAEMLDHSAARLFSLPEDVRKFRAEGPATLVTVGLSCAA